MNIYMSIHITSRRRAPLTDTPQSTLSHPPTHTNTVESWRLWRRCCLNRKQCAVCPRVTIRRHTLPTPPCTIQPP